MSIKNLLTHDNIIGSENKIKKRMNICSLGSGVGLLSGSRLFSAGIGSWTVIVQVFKVEQFLEDVAKGFRILKRKLVMTEGSYMAAMG